MIRALAGEWSDDDRERPDAAPTMADARLRRLFDANVVGILIANNAGAIVEANDAFLTMIGYTRAELIAGAIDWRRLTPPEWLPLDEAAIRTLAVDGAFAPYEKEYVRKDGTRVPISVGGARLPESTDEQICYIIDVSATRAAEAAHLESETRYRMLADALPQVVMVSDEARRPIYVNPHYEAYTGISSSELPARWAEPIHPDDIPAIERARATGDSYDVEYRLRRASDGAYRWHFARCMKIAGTFPGYGWLATAMDIDDRKRAEDTLRFIERASTRLSQSLDLSTTFDTILDLVIPEFGEWASIATRDEDGRIITNCARHCDPALNADVQQLCGVDYYRDANRWETGAVYRTGEPQVLASVSRDHLESVIADAYLPLFERLGFGTMIVVPIVHEDEVVGSIGIRSTSDRRVYTSADLPPLQELARRAGFAIGNARRFEREQRVANVLQTAALPRTLPEIAGFRFDAYYQAGRTEALIGGDWFDAHVVAGGRIVVSVGDVAGNGLKAAVLMGNVRQVLRAAAHLTGDPFMMLEIADRTLRSEHRHTQVTAFVGVIDPATMTMEYSSAGHWPALLRTAEGDIVTLQADGLPLGCRDLGVGEGRTIALPPDSCLLLHTDGLVEWSRDIDAGDALVREHFGAADLFATERPARTLVEHVLGTMVPSDDIAVLTVSMPSSAA